MFQRADIDEFVKLRRNINNVFMKKKKMISIFIDFVAFWRVYSLGFYCIVRKNTWWPKVHLVEIDHRQQEANSSQGFWISAEVKKYCYFVNMDVELSILSCVQSLTYGFLRSCVF